MTQKHTAPQGGEAAALPATCAKCRDNFPMPVAMDYFDQRVIADYTQRRSACTAVVDANKPCLRPAPAAPSTSETENNMDGMVRMDARRQLVALDAAIELESLARLLPRLVPDDGDNSHQAHYAVRGVAGRVLRLSSVLMSALSDESETTEHLERVLNLDCGQG